MHLPSHKLNPKHRDALRSVLERKSAQVFAVHGAAPEHHLLGSLSKKKKWEFGMLTVSLTAGLVVFAIFTYTQPSSTEKFIAEAEAAYKAQPANEDGVVHQKYIAQYDNGDGTTHDVTFETWTHADAYANIVSSTDEIFDKHVEFTDSTAKRRGFELHPVPGQIFAAENWQGEEDTQATFCTVNSADIPHADDTASASNATVAFEKGAATQSRADAIAKILQSKNVKDLGEHDGVRSFQITTDDLVYVYSFDPKTYALKKYTEALTQTDQFGNPTYTNTYEYLVDETLDVSPLDLPIFNDVSGLTEIVLAELPVPNLDQLPTGCYDQQGTKVGDVQFTVTADGDLQFSSMLSSGGN